MNTPLLENEDLISPPTNNNNLNKLKNLTNTETKSLNQLTVRSVDSLNKSTPLEEIIISDSEET